MRGRGKGVDGSLWMVVRGKERSGWRMKGAACGGRGRGRESCCIVQSVHTQKSQQIKLHLVRWV
jgi:hypothetical protein